VPELEQGCYLFCGVPLQPDLEKFNIAVGRFWMFSGDYLKAEAQKRREGLQLAIGEFKKKWK